MANLALTTILKALAIFSFSLFAVSSCANESLLKGTHFRANSSPKAAELNQHQVHKNSCGPCAIAISLHTATPSWQLKIPQLSTEELAIQILEESRSSPSPHHSRQTRWEPLRGMRLLDLTETLKEKTNRAIKLTETSRESSETAKQQLRRCHKALVHSMNAGLPPILSLKLNIHKKFNSQPGYYWVKTKGHYIVLESLSKHLPTNAESFRFRYFDPFDGRSHYGTLAAAPQIIESTSPILRKKAVRNTVGLTATLPNLEIAQNSIPSNGTSTLVVDSIVGAK